MAMMVLRHIFPNRHRDESNLGRLLAQHCPDELTFHLVENAIVRNLMILYEDVTTVPQVDTNERCGPILPQKVLAELANATRAEVFRVVTGFCEWLASDSLRFQHRTLFYQGREVALWREQDDNNRPQIDLLTAFQAAKWASPIQNPLHRNFDLGVVVRNVNRKVKKWIHIRHSNNYVFWRGVRRIYS